MQASGNFLHFFRVGFFLCSWPSGRQPAVINTLLRFLVRTRANAIVVNALGKDTGTFMQYQADRRNGLRHFGRRGVGLMQYTRKPSGVHGQAPGAASGRHRLLVCSAAHKATGSWCWISMDAKK